MGFQVLDVPFAGLALNVLSGEGACRFRLDRLARLLIGNLLDVPIDAPYKTFGAMSSKYGKYMLPSYKEHASLSTPGPIISDGHVIRRTQLPRGHEGPTREEDRHHIEQAALYDGR